MARAFSPQWIAFGSPRRIGFGCLISVSGLSPGSGAKASRSCRLTPCGGSGWMAALDRSGRRWSALRISGGILPEHSAPAHVLPVVRADSFCPVTGKGATPWRRLQMQFMESPDLSPTITTPSRPWIFLLLPLYRNIARVFAFLCLDTPLNRDKPLPLSKGSTSLGQPQRSTRLLFSLSDQGCRGSFNAASKRYHRSATSSSPTEIRIRYRDTPQDSAQSSSP